MKKQFIFLFLFFCLFIQGFSFVTIDSVGVSTVKGVKYIVHEVEAGETLYALSRKYGIGVQAIKDANKGTMSGLNIGQKILIPYVLKEIPEGAEIHIVSSSETLFSISRLYGIQVEDLKRWNNLTENSISIGQELIVKSGTSEVKEPVLEQQNSSSNRKTHTVEQSQTLYSISRMYNISTDQIIEWNSLGSSALDIGQVLYVSEGQHNHAENEDVSSNSSMLPTEESSNSDEIKPQEGIESNPIEVVATPLLTEEEDNIIAKPAKKVIQKGMCEVIENAPDTKKYLAFHRDAPVGTIMQVRNEMNNQSVFVRVVNTIPKTGDNSKLILKISKKAFDRLGAVDKRFPVEISYIP